MKEQRDLFQIGAETQVIRQKVFMMTLNMLRFLYVKYKM